MTAIIAISNQKGGVGKTATTLGLAAAARAAGARVLVIDLDPQANATDVLTLPDVELGDGAFGLLADPKHGGGQALSEVIVAGAGEWVGVDLVPGSRSMAEVDTDTGATQPLRLRKALGQGRDSLAHYDVVLMDCPPSLGRVLLAGLVAATHVVIVTEPAGHALQGVGRLEETMTEVRDGFEQSTPRLLALLINRGKRTAEAAFREQELRESYGPLVLDGIVPERTAVADAASAGLPIHAMKSPGASAVTVVLDALWAQLDARLREAAPTPAATPSS